MSVYSGTYEQSSSPDGRPGRRQRHCKPYAWKPIELVATILGFILFWPIGLAIVLAKVWQTRSAYSGNLPSFIQMKWEEKVGRHWAGHEHYRDFAARQWGQWNPGMRSTGNRAFDDWRTAELARLEEERQKLLAAEREFAEFMENLRHAKDREEFDRFMNARRNGEPSAPPPQG
jgi:Protein of unknown function (DUF2852)